MSIQEQIVAFLDGELTDETALSELMHVLAVSPEKRAFLVAQSRLTRLTATLSQSIVPSASADAAVMAGIASIDDVGHVAARPSASPSGPSTTTRPWRSGGLLLLPVVGLLAGYLMWGGEPVDKSIDARAHEPAVVGLSSRTGGELQGCLGAIHSGLAGELDRAVALRRATTPLLAELQRMRRLLTRRSAAIAQGPAFVIEGSPTTDSAPRIEPSPSSEATVQSASTVSLDRAAPRPARLVLSNPSRTVHPAPAPPASRSELLPDHTQQRSGPRQVSIGVRNLVRLSLPRIYGIPAEQSVFTDRELTIGFRMDEGALGLRSPLIVAGSIGETRFAQSFRRHEGGSSVSTVIEQTPNLLYGRGWIAPQLLSIDGFAGGVELGAGGTAVGPFATIGLVAEYRPIDVLSMDLGVASWMLFSQLDAQNVVSANLNAHIGASIWF